MVYRTNHPEWLESQRACDANQVQPLWTRQRSANQFHQHTSCFSIGFGESTHQKRIFLFFANRGKVRRKQEDQQLNQTSCLNLITNAVITWNTVYINAVIEQISAEGVEFSPLKLAHIYPCRFRHVNPFVKYDFNLDTELSIEQLRPLKHPKGFSRTWWESQNKIIVFCPNLYKTPSWRNPWREWVSLWTLWI